MIGKSKLARFASIAMLTSLAVAMPFGASADVRKEGSWPSPGKPVSLSFDGAPGEGLERLAKEAGWSLVLAKDAVPTGGDVHVAVTDQPADAVLDALFVNDAVVARRSGDLVTVTRAGNPPAAAPAPAATTAPSAESARDREAVGGTFVLRKDETARDVTVTGGTARIEGEATGDVVVMGGSATIARGAHVRGSATVLGGTLRVEDGARVDGHAGVVGGVLTREKGAMIGGEVVVGESRRTSHTERVTEAKPEESAHAGRLGVLHELGRRMTRWALLFVLGCVLLSLLAGPMEKVRVESAARPMRSFAVGVVSAIGIVVAITVVTITIVGIPLAVLSVLVLALGLYGSIAAVLTTVGAALSGHRSRSPFVHLAVGCVVALAVGSLPWIGGLSMVLLGFTSLGALVATRAGGLAVARSRRTGLV